MQYIITFNDKDQTYSQVSNLLAFYNIDNSDIERKFIIKKNGKRELSICGDPTSVWSSKDWLQYLISKGFWIDSYTKYSSVYAGSEDMAIVHKTI